MSDLVGNHIVGFPTRRLISRLLAKSMLAEWVKGKKSNVYSLNHALVDFLPRYNP